MSSATEWVGVEEFRGIISFPKDLSGGQSAIVLGDDSVPCLWMQGVSDLLILTT